MTFNPGHGIVPHHGIAMVQWGTGALLLIGIVLSATSSARSQLATNPEAALFTPANDVAFTISTLRQRYTVREPFAVSYQIVNVSPHSLYVPTLQTPACPSFAPHVMTTLEDSAGRHTGSGYGVSCAGTFPMLTLAERIAKEGGVLLERGAHVSGTIQIDPTRAGGIAPGAYRIEATLHGWSARGFQALTAEEMRQLPDLGAPLLGGEAAASKGITLTR